MRTLKKIVLGFGVLALFLVCSRLEGVLAAERTQPARRGHAPIAWVGSVVTSLVYTPVKAVYAGSGGLVAGLAYLITAGDDKAFYGIWRPTAGGTYVITPSMLEGNEPVHFVGP